MTDETYYVLRHRPTGVLLPVLYTTGREGQTPMLYTNERRAREARSKRVKAVANPSEWDIVPVRLTVVSGEAGHAVEP